MGGPKEKKQRGKVVEKECDKKENKARGGKVAADAGEFVIALKSNQH